MYNGQNEYVPYKKRTKRLSNGQGTHLPVTTDKDTSIGHEVHSRYCVGECYHFLKGGITPEEDHEDLNTSWKIEGRSENVVQMKPFQVYKIILRPNHVLTTFTPRPCQVLTTSTRFPMSSYHALTTLTPFIVR